MYQCSDHSPPCKIKIPHLLPKNQQERCCGQISSCCCSVICSLKLKPNPLNPEASHWRVLTRIGDQLISQYHTARGLQMQEPNLSSFGDINPGANHHWRVRTRAGGQLTSQYHTARGLQMQEPNLLALGDIDPGANHHWWVRTRIGVQLTSQHHTERELLRLRQGSECFKCFGLEMCLQIKKVCFKG